DLKLLFVGHGGAGALLAIAQGRIEDDDAVLLGLSLRGHGKGPFRYAPVTCGLTGDRALWGFWLNHPLSAQAQMPSRPSGASKEQAQNKGGNGQAGGTGRGGRPG